MSTSPTGVGRRKVEMSDKWQQISVKLDGELAQALREMKQGHEESLSDVVLRLLRKVVRQSSGGARADATGRSNPKAARGRGAFGAGKRGKPMAGAPAAFGGAAQGKPSAPRAAPAAGAWGAPRGKRTAAAGATRPRFAPAAGKTGKASRPPQLDGSGEARRRDFRPRSDGPRPMRPSDELGTAENRPQRPRKAKGSRSSRG